LSQNLWSTNVKAAETYVALVKNDCEMENIATQIPILKQCCDQTNRRTQNDEKILNKIDRDITKILLRAEQDCKQAKGHALSPLLAHAGKWSLLHSGTCLTFSLVAS
jgi:methylaspartate ammonia-lyase